MNATPGPLRNALRNKPLIAGLLLGLFLFVLAVAHSGALHHSVCTEAAAPDHKCAATLLNCGQIHVTAGAISVTTIPRLVVACAPAEPSFLAVADYSLLPSRGPPASLT